MRSGNGHFVSHWNFNSSYFDYVQVIFKSDFKKLKNQKTYLGKLFVKIMFHLIL